MSIITHIIGGFILAAILMAIPILAVCAIVFEWIPQLIIGFVALSVWEFVCLARDIVRKAEEGK